MNTNVNPPVRRAAVAPNVLESIAFNLCSLHDFDVAFVRENERFARAVITEYARCLLAGRSPEVGEATADVLVRIKGRAESLERIGATQDASDLRAVLKALASREEAPAEAGEIDLYDDKVQAGIAWTMRQWGETLGLKTWDMGDGSESVEGDVGAEIHTILVDAGLRDPETNEMASLPQASDDDQLTAAEAWSDLLDKDDRTSPEDQPERCLITAGELADYMARAQPQAREDAQPVAYEIVRYETYSGAVWISPDKVDEYRTKYGCVLRPLYTRRAPGALRVAVTDIAAERQRQVDVEGWSEAHDDEHDSYQMARAAGCYAFHASREDDDGDTGMFVSAAVHHGWPWDRAWWKPKSRRTDLVRAGALIVAEIERLDRAALQAEPKGGAA